MKVGIVVCAAGKGTRVGGDIPKQFIKIGEKRVIDYTLDNILMSGVFDDVILVIRPGDRYEYEDYFGMKLTEEEYKIIQKFLNEFNANVNNVSIKEVKKD